MGAMKWILLACILGFPGKGLAQQIVPDSEVVIFRIRNYRAVQDSVFLDAMNGKRHFVAVIEGGHEAFLVLVSRDLAGIEAFILSVVPLDPTIRPYRTGVVQRKPGKLLLMVVEVANDSTQSLPQRS